MNEIELTPKQIVAELDKYIVGQGEAKKSVAIALRNRWRRKRLSEDMQNEIIPKNILLIGPTGVGKTEIARRLARLVGAPFIKVEATKYTEVGYVGRDVEQIIRDLVANAIRMVQEQESQRYERKAEEEANKRILQVLWPKKKSVTDKVPNPMDVFFSSGDEGEEKEEPKQLEEPMSGRRQQMLDDIRQHKMDDREIEVEVAEQERTIQGILTGNSTEELTNNFQEMLGSILPKKKKMKKMTIAKAREVFKEEELEKCLQEIEIRTGADIHMEFPKSPVYAFANDDELVQTAKYVGKEMFGEKFVLEGEDELFLSGDNAYRYFRETKGLFTVFLAGIRGEEYPLHHPKFRLDERILPFSVEALYEIVRRIGSKDITDSFT